MRGIVLLTISMFIIFSGSFLYAAEWKLVSQVEVPGSSRPSGCINQFMFHPSKSNVIYAATENTGVLASEDSGKSWVSRWTFKTEGLSQEAADWGTDYSVKCIAIDPVNPDTMYAGLGMLGVLKTTDAGNSWTEINEMLTDTYVRVMTIHPDRPNVIYLGTEGGGVYRRAAKAGTWEEITEGMRNTHINALAIAPKNPDIMYAATNGGISKTTNGGKNWVTVNNGLTTGYMLCLAIDPVDAKTIYAGSDGGGLFKSEDGGDSWLSVGGDIWMTEFLPGNLASVVSAAAVNPANSSIVYAANSSGVFRSSDRGQNWVNINTGLASTKITSLTLTAAAPIMIYAGTEDGKVFVYAEE